MTGKRETRAERQRRLAKRDLAAQESGEWQPAPAGLGALAADVEGVRNRRRYAELTQRISLARISATRERRAMRMAEAEGELDEALLADFTRAIRRSEDEAAQARTEIEVLKRKLETS